MLTNIISCVSSSVPSNFPELRQLPRLCNKDRKFMAGGGSCSLGMMGFGAVEVKRLALSRRW